MVKAIVIIIGILVIMSVIVECINNKAERDRINAEIQHKREARHRRDNADCAREVHICDGSGFCMNCHKQMVEDEKHICKCFWGGVPPRFGHQVCSNCNNLQDWRF